MLIGPTPPPLGGVSVFISRHGSLLQRKGKKVKYIDRGKMNLASYAWRLLWIALYPGVLSIHIHWPHAGPMLAALLRFFPGELVFVDHASRLIESFSGARAILFRLFLRRVDKVVLVNKHLRGTYLSGGFSLPDTTVEAPAFIPPLVDEEPEILGSYPHEVRRFVDTHAPLLTANAFSIVVHEGVDLYGIDLCIELVRGLVGDFQNIGLLIAVAANGDADYVEDLERRIVSYGLGDRIMFMKGNRQLWPLFRKSQLMIRPTFRDGDAVSVREALSLGCPVVASDVVPRPEGVAVFHNRDLQDFQEKVTHVIRKT